jgi:pimeloyl-ACP methyl ester carboxylesterase
MVNVLMKTLQYLLVIIIVISCKPYENVSPVKSMSDISYKYEVLTEDLSDNITIAYVDEGPKNARTLLFIHGLGSYLPAWNKNIDELSKKYRCIAIDLPGYGKSSKGNHDYSMKFFAGVIDEFLQKLEIENAVYVGHSMGGQISITSALYFPERVSELVLVSPAGFETFTEGQKEWFRDVFTPNLVKLTPVEAIQSNLAFNFYDLPKDAQFMIEDRIAIRTAVDFENYCYAVSKSVQAMVDDPVFDFLGEIKIPVLVLFGENDNLIPNRYLNPGFTKNIAKKGTSKIPDAQLEMIPKCGHFAQFEKSGIVNESIDKFLNK